MVVAAIVPTFLVKEVRCGPTLGHGSFCEVLAVKFVSLVQEEEEDDDDETKNTNHHPQQQQQRQRQRLARMYGNHLYQDPMSRPPRLALKRLKETLSSNELHAAQQDMQRELEILLAVRHPHILELHAVGRHDDNYYGSSSGGTGNGNGNGSDGPPSFLVLTRIRATLDNLLHKWRNQRGLGLWVDEEAAKTLWLERLIILSKVAGAIECLHSHRILYRDIKPGNIGIDDNDVPKLYDFGLAKSMPKHNGPYRLTGKTGTLRYMAPEVALYEPYDASADVYSLGILSHLVLSLLIPFANVAPSKFETQVIVGNERPALDSSWPLALQALLRGMWHAHPTDRPTSHQVVSTLETLLRGTEEELFPATAASMIQRFLGV